MGIMAMDIEYHQNRMPHTASVSVQWVSWPWASGSWCRLNRHHTRHGYRLHRCLSPPEDTTHGISIDCMGISSMSIGNCHHRTRKRHQHRLHGYGIGIGSMGIMAMGIWFMVLAAYLQRMPHMVWVSAAWIWVSWPWASGSWYRLHEY